jgi:hypothetical protein
LPARERGNAITSAGRRANPCLDERVRQAAPLRRCTERNAKIVDFYLYLAAALVTIRQLIQRARRRYRWDTRPRPNG